MVTAVFLVRLSLELKREYSMQTRQQKTAIVNDLTSRVYLRPCAMARGPSVTKTPVVL